MFFRIFVFLLTLFLSAYSIGIKDIKDQTGVFEIIYFSSILDKTNSFELSLPDNRSEKGKENKQRPNKWGKEILRPVIYLLDEGCDLKKVKSQDFMLIKPRFSGELTNSNEQKSVLLKELRSLIDLELKVDKNRIFLVSSLESFAVFSFYNFDPSQYTGIGLIETSEILAQSNFKEVNIGFLEKEPKPLLFIENQIDSDTTFQTYKTNLTKKLLQLFEMQIMKIGYDYGDSYIKSMPVLYSFFKDKKSGEIPDKISFETDNLAFYASLYYLTINEAEYTDKPARINAEMKDNVVKILTDNVKKFEIDLTYRCFKKYDTYTIYHNDSVVFKDAVNGHSRLVIKGFGTKYQLY